MKNLAKILLSILILGLASVGCDGNVTTGEPGEDTGADLDTDTDTDVDEDTDTDSDEDVDTGEEDTGELDTYWQDYEALYHAYDFDAVDPAWLEQPWAEEWPHPLALPIQAGLCQPNYASNFWIHLECFNTQSTQIDPNGDGAFHTCTAAQHAAPPKGTPFTCDFWICSFFQNLLYPESTYYYPAICKDGAWTCAQCYAELYDCLLDARDTCTNWDDTDSPADKMYLRQPNFRSCYYAVTGFDRCRWVMSDACADVVGPCSGPEWPPI